LFCLKHIHIRYKYIYTDEVEDGRAGACTGTQYTIFLLTLSCRWLFAQFPTPSPPLWQLQALWNSDPIRQVQIVGRVADTHGARNCVMRPLLPYRPWNLLGGRETWLESMVRWEKKMSTNMTVIVLYWYIYYTICICVRCKDNVPSTFPQKHINHMKFNVYSNIVELNFVFNFISILLLYYII